MGGFMLSFITNPPVFVYLCKCIYVCKTPLYLYLLNITGCRKNSLHFYSLLVIIDEEVVEGKKDAIFVRKEELQTAALA